MRREYDKNPAKERRLYYSDVDKRIHLFGAQEGWIEIGHIFGDEKIGEIRYFDTNGDGFFDRWEFDLNNDGRPERIATLTDPKARRVPFEYNSLSQFYNKDVLPKAIDVNQKVIAAMKGLVSLDDKRVFKLEDMANRTDLVEKKRYLLDIVREFYYEALLDKLYHVSKADPYVVASREGRSLTREEGFESEKWWQLTRDISILDQNYNSGNYEAVLEILKKHDYLTTKK